MAAPVSIRPTHVDAERRSPVSAPGDRVARKPGRVVELPTDDAGPPPEIIRFRAGHDARGDEYYQALGAAAQVRLRLLGTMHARAELDDTASGDQRAAVRARLAAQRRRVWRQLQWITTEMRRLDGDT